MSMKNIYTDLDCLKKDDLTASEDKWDELVANISESLKKNGSVEINFEGVERLTPSLAYNAFGRLVDSFGKDVLKNLKTANSPSLT